MITVVAQAMTLKSRELTYSPIRSLFVDQQQHEDQDKRQHDAVNDLGENRDLDQGQTRNQDDAGAGQQ